MDWRFYSEVGDNKSSRAQRRKQTAIGHSFVSAPGPALTKDDVNEILSRGIASLRDDLIAATPSKVVRWWERPIGSAIIGGLVVLAVGGLVGGAISHSSKDSATQIGDEITRQLDQRATADAENLKNRIATEIGKQLLPIHQQIAGMSQDLGRIKDRLKIARNVEPSAGSPLPQVDLGLRRFEKMDKKQFAMSLSALRTATQQSSAPPDQVVLRNIAGKLRETDPTAPAYWPTVFAFITWASGTSGKNVPPSNAKTTISIANTPPLTAGVMLYELVVALDGGEINGLTFRNCRIRFTSNAVQLNYVTFVNCVFEFPAVPTPYLKRATRKLLEADNLRSVSVTLHS
jgi:hypothetical protein